MTFFASTYEWPTTTIDFYAVGSGASDGSGEILERGDRFILKAPGCFSGATGQPGSRVLRTTIGDRPALIRGVLFVIDGDFGLRVDELRIGSDDVEPTYTEASAMFEHLSSLCSYRHEDGRQRSSNTPINLPALTGVQAMTATLQSQVDVVKIVSPSAVALDDFEAHFAALQDLMTFGADLPVGRISLSAVDSDGRTVQIFGRERFAPFETAPRRPVEYLLRLSGEWLQIAIDRWWSARETLRPIPQVVAGLRYQPGYVEADVIFSAAATEALATRMDLGERPRLSVIDSAPILAALDALSGLNADQREVVANMKAEATRTTLRSRVELLIGGISGTAITNSRVVTQNWLPRFIETRNSIAHGSNGSRRTSDIWSDDALLRAVRDANRVVLALALLTQLGVPDAAVERSAERLGARYGGIHRATTLFQ